LAFLYSNLIRISGVVTLPPMAKILGISASTVGFLSSLFFYTYAVSFVIWGTVADRIGPFRTCGISLVIAASASMILAFAGTPLSIGLGRALSGLGLSSAFTSIMLYTAHSFSKDRYSFLVGIIMMIGHSGTVVAIAPLGYALDTVGITGVYCTMGAAALIIGLLMLLFRNFDPVLLQGKKDSQPLSLSRFKGDITDGAKIIIASFPLLVIVLTWVTSSASISTLQGLWAVSWLQTTTGAELSSCRTCATWISIGMVVGPLIGGFIVKSIRGRKMPFMVMCVLTQISWLMWMAASLMHTNINVLGAVGFLTGFFSGIAFVYMGSAIRDLTPPRSTGTVIGLLNLMIYGLLILFQWGTGFILDLFPAGDIAGTYSQTGYQVGFGVIVLIQGYSFYLISKTRSFIGDSGQIKTSIE
jgi:MFS family permease